MEEKKGENQAPLNISLVPYADDTEDMETKNDNTVVTDMTATRDNSDACNQDLVTGPAQEPDASSLPHSESLMTPEIQLSEQKSSHMTLNLDNLTTSSHSSQNPETSHVPSVEERENNLLSDSQAVTAQCIESQEMDHICDTQNSVFKDTDTQHVALLTPDIQDVNSELQNDMAMTQDTNAPTLGGQNIDLDSDKHNTFPKDTELTMDLRQVSVKQDDMPVFQDANTTSQSEIDHVSDTQNSVAKDTDTQHVTQVTPEVLDIKNVTSDPQNDMPMVQSTNTQILEVQGIDLDSDTHNSVSKDTELITDVEQELEAQNSISTVSVQEPKTVSESQIPEVQEMDHSSDTQKSIPIDKDTLHVMSEVLEMLDVTPVQLQSDMLVVQEENIASQILESQDSVECALEADTTNDNAQQNISRISDSEATNVEHSETHSVISQQLQQDCPQVPETDMSPPSEIQTTDSPHVSDTQAKCVSPAVESQPVDIHLSISEKPNESCNDSPAALLSHPVNDIAPEHLRCQPEVAVSNSSSNLFSGYRSPDSSVNDSDSSDSTDFEFPVIENKSASEDENEEKRNRPAHDPDKVRAFGLVRTRGELTVDDLPPIGELKITVGDGVKLVDLGEVMSVVGVLVVVKSISGLPPLDDGTILFMENRNVMGQVFETLGPVVAPYYSIRFNSATEITEKGISIGQKIFYAPDMTEYTHYVFVAQIQKMRGSDASWENNNEPPMQCLDYSDDEEEKKAKRERARQNRNNRDDSSSDEDGNEDKPRPKFRRRTHRGQQGQQNQDRKPEDQRGQQQQPRQKFPSAEFENPFLKVWPPPPNQNHQWRNQAPPPPDYSAHSYSHCAPIRPPPRDMRHVQNNQQPPSYAPQPRPPFFNQPPPSYSHPPPNQAPPPYSHPPMPPNHPPPMYSHPPCNFNRPPPPSNQPPMPNMNYPPPPQMRPLQRPEFGQPPHYNNNSFPNYPPPPRPSWNS